MPKSIKNSSPAELVCSMPHIQKLRRTGYQIYKQQLSKARKMPRRKKGQKIGKSARPILLLHLTTKEVEDEEGAQNYKFSCENDKIMHRDLATKLNKHKKQVINLNSKQTLDAAYYSPQQNDVQKIT